MRCLYCGKELALLKRWTRGGQFCSEAHKKSYQEEYNRIGLNRLLQAQNKSTPAKVVQAQDDSPSTNGPTRVRETQVAVELEEPPAVEEVSILEASAEAELEVEARAEVEETAELQESADEQPWEPVRLAEFLKEQPAEPAQIEIPPYSEPWEASLTPPAPPEWRTANRVQQNLQQASIVELKFRPNLSDTEYSLRAPAVGSTEFARGRETAPSIRAMSFSNKLRGAGPVQVEVVPRTWDAVAAAAWDGFLQFRVESPSDLYLLDPPCPTIAFPAADADVELTVKNLAAASTDEASSPDVFVAQAEAEAVKSEILQETAEAVHTSTACADPAGVETELPIAESSTTPELQGLVKLHEELTQPSEALPMADSAVPELASAEPEEVGESTPLQRAAVEEETAAPQAQPRKAELVDMPLKPLPPAKPAPKSSAGAQIELPVFLPRVTGLPLRPKMGLVQSAPGAAKKPGQRPPGQAAQATPEAKPTPESKQAETRPAPSSAAAPEPTPKAWAKPSQQTPARPMPQSAPSSKFQKQTAKEASPAKEAAKDGAKQAAAIKEKPVKNTEPAAPAKPPEPAKKSAKGVAEPSVPEKPVIAAKTPFESAEHVPGDIEAPSFGVAQTASTSFLSSLKGKMAIGGVLIALGLGAYFIFGGKPQAPVAPTAAATDVAGPSIMVGGGGWVEGWAGDPTGAHYGRQITIYRPSLKLSDYRIDFKGEIETKSLGWVFRATDPENYYAMKLAIVKPGTEPKIALLKYIVTHGREAQVGRVPVNLDVRLDTLYSVRVDVRGSKFTTYVLGQQVDVWTDDQLKVGGVGFLNEREERGRIKSVSVSLLNGGK